MNKKVIYGAVFILVMVLGYINYFGEEESLSTTEQVIETTNVTYKNDDYLVEAEKQKDYIKENETAFEKAKAQVNEMLLSGDNVLIDKVRNLVLKNNILGITPNGWSFKTDSANYNKLKDEITSNTGVMAINEEKGIKISGKNFLTDSKMSFIELTENVTLENEDISLSGDRGTYNDFTKVVVLSDNISLNGKNENIGIVDGKFKNLRYNTETRILEAWEPFEAEYKGVKLSAENLFFKEDTQELKISKNVVINSNGFKIDVKEITKKPNSNILNITGKIIGTDGVYSFTGDRGEYNTDTRVLTILGGINGSSTKGEKLVADKLVYDFKTSDMHLFANNNISYISVDGELLTKTLNYNTKTKEISTEGKYSFIGKKYESRGEKLFYNQLTQDMQLTKGYVIDKEKNQKIQGDLITYNTQTKDSKVSGKAYLEDLNYILKTDLITYIGEKAEANLEGKYTVELKKDGTLFKGQNASYNQNTGKFFSSGDIIIQGDDYVVNGRDLSYNNSTGLGKLGSSIRIESVEKNLEITGDDFQFKNGEYVEISKNLLIKSDKIIAKSEKGKYNLKDKLIYIPQKITFETLDKKSNGVMSSGVYDTTQSIFKGKDFDGKSDNRTIKSKSMNYFAKEDKVLFVGNVIIKDLEYLYKGEKAEYYFKEEIVKSLEAYTINYRDFTFKGQNGTFNNKTGILDGNGSDITDKNGDRFISNKLHGDLNQMILDFTGDVKGKINDKGVITTFSGESARVYFKENGNYEILRSEIRENAVFIQGNKKLYSDYIEIDSNRRLVFSKENTKLVVNDSNGETVITSAVVEVDIDKDIATLIGKVQIDNNNSQYGNTKVTSDRGIIRQKDGILELIGHVEIENDESIVQADRGIYDINNKKIKASGNVYVDYKK